MIRIRLREFSLVHVATRLGPVSCWLLEELAGSPEEEEKLAQHFLAKSSMLIDAAQELLRRQNSR